VLIVGAGPVGLTLALDLGRRGIRCTLVERNASSIQLPKMERCNGRTMEIYRRLGVSEAIRAAGLPREAPMDVFLTRSLAEPPIAHLPYPSVAAASADIAAHNDGTRLLEPYQLISQYTLEPLLRSLVEALPTVKVRFGCELASFAQTAGRVQAQVRDGSGPITPIEATYLAWLNVAALGLADPIAHFEAHGVGLSEGAYFASPKGRHVRINFGCPRVTLAEALQRMKVALT